jgi:hypothetical protein
MKDPICWKRVVDGRKIEIIAHRQPDRQWKFFRRMARNERREFYEAPVEEWLELLDAVERRIARRLLKPSDAEAIRREIGLRFPGTELPPPR